MKITASKEGDIRYFTVKLGFKESFNLREIDLLTSFELPTLIAPRSVQGKKNNHLSFDISPYSTLDYYLSFILSREQFADLLLQGIATFQEMKKMYLDHNNLVLEFDKIYLLLADRSLRFIYIPFDKKNKMSKMKEVSIKDFFCKIISSANCTTNEQAIFAKDCLQFLEQSHPFILQEFHNFIQKKINPTIPIKSAVEPIHQWGSETEDSDATIIDNQTNSEKNCDNTELLSWVGWYLLDDTQQRIPVTGYSFTIGRAEEDIDFQITNNPKISKTHTKISIKGENCTIEDLNSTNKTYLNETQLLPQEPRELHEGDIIRLANNSSKVQFTWCKEPRRAEDVTEILN